MRFAWPLPWPQSDPRLRITNYVDHAPDFGLILDYMGLGFTYDGHYGTDININSFADMDEGVPVLAAANGRVIYVVDGNYDRMYEASPVPANGVQLVHEDGSTSLYWHLRTNSTMVQLGEYVREGQQLGFVGSSGFTMTPHLHFEGRDPTGNFDPWSGPANPFPSLWKHQEDYYGDDHLVVHILGVTTGSAFFDEGSLLDWSAFKEKPSQPVVFGADEPNLKVWVLLSGQPTEPYRVEVHRPDGSIFGQVESGVTAYVRHWGEGYQYYDFPFNGRVSAADYGEWYAQILFGGVPVSTDRFTVGETSRYAPRFHWLAGKSLHLSTERQQDVLSLSFLGAPPESLTFALENAPSNVSLATDEFGQTIVLIDPAGPDLANVRSREFAVVATDPDGRQGRMRYHLVNDAASTLGSPPVAAAPGSVSGIPGDTVTVDVSASDADGDEIAGLTADLSGLPSGHGATFTVGGGNTMGRLVWPTRAGGGGTYAVTFTARTSLGSGYPEYYGYPATVQTGTATTRITLVEELAARAFTIGGNRTLRLSSHGHHSHRAPWCVNVEPVKADFRLTDIDLASVELVSDGTGTVDRISPYSRKRIVVEDWDRNCVADIAFCFANEDLGRLFSAVKGRRRLTATIHGTLVSGAKFSAAVTLNVVASGRDRDDASISPNPLNPDAILTLSLSHPGPVRVQIFDTQGRLVRTLLDTSFAPAGPLELRVEARDGAGSALSSGVYFYQVSTSDGATTGRFVVLK